MVIQLFNWDRREKHPISIKTHLEFDQKLAWKTWKKPGISCEVHAENPEGLVWIFELGVEGRLFKVAFATLGQERVNIIFYFVFC